jgi:hypothetical protein
MAHMAIVKKQASLFQSNALMRAPLRHCPSRRKSGMNVEKKFIATIE